MIVLFTVRTARMSGRAKAAARVQLGLIIINAVTHILLLMQPFGLFIVDCWRDQFQCPRGGCLYSAYTCDGVNNCGDWSDEQSCGWFHITTTTFIYILYIPVKPLQIARTSSGVRPLGFASMNSAFATEMRIVQTAKTTNTRAALAVNKIPCTLAASYKNMDIEHG